MEYFNLNYSLNNYLFTYLCYLLNNKIAYTIFAYLYTAHNQNTRIRSTGLNTGTFEEYGTWKNRSFEADLIPSSQIARFQTTRFSSSSFEKE